MTQTQIFKKALKKYGLELQMIVCIEEMSELTKELTKTIRKKGNINNIIEEIADVEITTAEIKQYLGIKNDVNVQKQIKLKRLENRLNE